MSESLFKGEFKKQMKLVDEDIHITDIESPITAAGFPDTEMCSGGSISNIEFKFSKNNRCPDVRSSQVQWFKRRVKAGGEPWVLARIWHTEEWLTLLIPGIHMEEIARTHNLQVWVDLADLAYDEDEMAIGGWQSIYNRITQHV